MPTLHALLSWANHQYRLETPELQHDRGDDDGPGGSPEMKPAVEAYLGLQGKKEGGRVTKPPGRPPFGLPPISRTTPTIEPTPPVTGEPDDWRRLACRVDEDGRYRTPLRCAIERIGKPERRRFLRDLVPELYRPSDIATIHGIPDWCAGDVMFRSLSELRRNYRETPETQWITGRSDAQRSAEEAA